jgi:hypothetical protein
VVRYLVVLAIFTLGSSADSFLLLRAVDLGRPDTAEKFPRFLQTPGMS